MKKSIVAKKVALLAIVLLTCGVVLADYYDLSGSQGTSPAGWVLFGSWERGATGLTTTNSASLSLFSPISVESNDVVTVAAACGASDLVSSLNIALLDASDTVLTNRSFVLPADGVFNKYSFYHNLSATNIRFQITISGTSSNSTLRSVYYGHALEFNKDYTVNSGDMTNGWYSEGPLPWVIEPTVPTGYNFVIDTGAHYSSTRGLLKQRFQVPPLPSGNILISFDIYNKPSSYSARNDHLLVWLQTNSWNSAAITVGGAVYQYDDQYPIGWRRVSMNRYISGLAGMESLELGFEGVPFGKSAGNIKIRNIKVSCSTTCDINQLLWNQDMSLVVGASALSFGETFPLFAAAQFRPPHDVKEFQYTVIREAANRGVCATNHYTFDPADEYGWLTDTNYPAVPLEAGETNLVRYVCEFGSHAGFATNSPVYYPGPTSDDWVTDVVRHLGTVWVNELIDNNGVYSAELTSYSGRSMPAGWYIVAESGLNGSCVTNMIPPHTFSDQNNGYGFLILPLVNPVAAAGTVRLHNSANVVEFSHEYDLTGGSWGASGSGEYVTDRDGWSNYAVRNGNFTFGSMSAATPGAINPEQGFELPINASVRVWALEDLSDPGSMVPGVLFNAKYSFSALAAPLNVKGVTGADGLTAPLYAEGEHISTNVVPVEITPSAFGFYANSVATNVAAGSTTVIAVDMDAGPGVDDFNETKLKEYWTVSTLSGTPIQWSVAPQGESYALLSSVGPVNSTSRSVLSPVNPLSPRIKRAITVAFNSYNTPSPYAARIDSLCPLISNGGTNGINWVLDQSIEFTAISNKNAGVTIGARLPYMVTMVDSALSTLSMSSPVYFGLKAMPFGQSYGSIYIDDLRVEFHDLLLGRSLAVKQYASDIAQPVTFDVFADVDAYGVEIKRVVPSIVWGSDAIGWTTNSLVAYLDWEATAGAAPGAEGSGVITITNNASLVATNLPSIGLSRQYAIEYYLLLEYDSDDGAPHRYEGTFANSDGSLKFPERRYYPDNSSMVAGRWSCVGESYAPQPRTTTVSGISDVWINEVSRGAAAGVADDFIEIAGTFNTDLTGWRVQLNDLASGALLGSHALAASLNGGAANDYAYYVIGGSAIGYTPNQALTAALPLNCGVTLYDNRNEIRSRISFNATRGDFRNVLDDTGSESWSAAGEGNPANRQYEWQGVGTATPGAPNATTPVQKVENGGPVGAGITALTVESVSILRITASGASDTDGVSTGVVSLVQINPAGVEVASFAFNGITESEFTVSNLLENTQYRASVSYTDTKGAAADGLSNRKKYTLLNTPDAPGMLDATTTTLTLVGAIPNLTLDVSGLQFAIDGTGLPWTQSTSTQMVGGSPNTVYSTTVTGRNGDGVESTNSSAALYCTLANTPDDGIIVRGTEWDPSFTLCVTNLTNGGAIAFGNPDYTEYAVAHSNLMTGSFGYLTTNSMAAGDMRVSDKIFAAWMPISLWNDRVVFAHSLSNDFFLVARNKSGVATTFGPKERVVAALQLKLKVDGQISGEPRRAAFNGQFMNPVNGNTVDMALQYSVDNGSSWHSATIEAGSVAALIDPQPTLDNNSEYPIQGFSSDLYTNDLVAAVWNITADLPYGEHYTVALRLAGRDTLSSSESASTNLLVDLKPPAARFKDDLSAITNASWSYSIEMLSSGAVDSVEWSYQFNGKARSGWSSANTNTFAVTTDGIYTINVWGRDAYGNEQSAGTPSVCIWTADTTPPAASEVAITAKNPAISAGDRTNVTNLTFEVAVSFTNGAKDPGAGYEWQFNSGARSVVTPVGNTFTVDSMGGANVLNTLKIWARDWLGNTAVTPVSYSWTVDTVAPVPSFEVTPAATDENWQTNALWSIKITGDDQVVAYSWTLDSTQRPLGMAVDRAQIVSTNVLTQGEHTLRVWGLDAAGNWSDAEFYTRTLDSIGPAAAIAGLPAAYTQVRDVNITVSTGPAPSGMTLDPNEVSRYDWTLVGPSPFSGSSVQVSNPINLVNSLADGVYTLSVWGYDPAGNRQVVPTTYRWSVDNLDPIVAFAAPQPPDLINTNTISFLMVEDQIDRNLGAIEWIYTVTNSAGIAITSGVRTTSSGFSVLTTSDDVYAISITGVDAAKNTNTVHDIHIWEVDFAAPPIHLIGVPTMFTRDDPAHSIYATNLVAAARRDQIKSWVAVLDAGAAPLRPEFALPVGVATNFGTLADGEHVMTVWACDYANNWTLDSNAYITNWIVDTAAPVARFGSSPSGTNRTYTVDVTMLTTGSVDSVAWNYQISGQAATGWIGSSQHTFNVSADGAYTISIWGRDAAGNEQPAPTTCWWYADMTAPTAEEVRINAVTPDIIGDGSVRTNALAYTFGVEIDLPGGAPDAGATFNWQLNNGVTNFGAQVADSFSTNSAAGGEVVNTLRVWAIDWLGNTAAAPETFVWTVDTVAPVAEYNVTPSATDATWQTNAVWNINITGDDQVVAYSWTLDDATRPAAMALVTNVIAAAAIPSQGDHTLRVWALDVAGNWSEAVTYTRALDSIPPVAAISGTPAAYTKSRGVNVIVSTGVVPSIVHSPNDVVRYDWTITGPNPFSGTRVSASNPIVLLDALDDGEYTLSVWGYDPAGNRQTTPTTHTWHVDNAAPSAAFENAPLPVDINTNAITFVMVTNTPLDSVKWRYAVTNSAGAVIVADNTTNTREIVVTNLVDGIYGIWIKGLDQAGNEQSIALTHRWEVDRIALTNFVVNGVPDEYVNVVNASVTARSIASSPRKDSVERWSAVLNAAAVKPAQSYAAGVEQPFVALGDQLNTLHVWAQDPAGNWSTAYTTNWYVDLTIPVAAFTEKPQAVTNASQAVFTMFEDGPLNAETWKYAVINTATEAEVVQALSTTNSWIVDLNNVEGDYRITVTAFDRAGNPSLLITHSWTLDQTPPVAQFSVSPIANGIWQTTNLWQVAVTGDVDVVAYTWSTDTTLRPAFELPISEDFQSGVLGEGAHSLRVWGRDIAGNWQTITVPYTKTVDTLPPPDVTIHNTVAPVNGYFKTNDFTFVISGTDVVAYRYTLDNPARPETGEFAVATPVLINGLADGEYTLRVWGRDLAGNWMVEPEVYVWSVDMAPPQLITITKKPVPDGGRTNVVDWTFGVEGDSDLYSYRWSIDNPEMPDMADILVALDFAVTNLADGAHTLRVWGRDRPGNWRPEPEIYLWTVDTIAPTALFAVTPAANGMWQTNNIWNVAVTGDMQVVDYRWALDGGTLSEIIPVTNNFVTQRLLDGVHTLSVWGRDVAGNRQGLSTRYTKTVDTLVPQPILENLPAYYMNASAIAVNITNAPGMLIEDQVFGYSWKLEFNAETLFDWSVETAAAIPLATNLVEDGEYTLSVVARDAAGNWSAQPGVVTNWVRDTEVPVAWFELPIAAYTNEANVSFTMGTAGVLDAIEWRYSLLGAASSDWTSVATTNVTVFQDGIYTNLVWARDAAGNEQQQPSTNIWSVDITAPRIDEIHIVAPFADGVRTNQLAVDFGVVVDLPNGSPDSGAMYVWSFNGSPYSPYASVAELFSVASAAGANVPNTVSVMAKDSFNNAQAMPVSFSWTVDTIAPEALFADGTPTNLLASLTTTFTFDTNATDAVLWICRVAGEGYLDERAVDNGVLPVAVPVDGDYTLSVWALDIAGNQQAQPLTHSWHVDTLAPSAQFEIVPAALVNTPTVRFTVVDDGDSVAWNFVVTNMVGTVITNGMIREPLMAFDVTMPEDGFYYIALIGRDLAGNANVRPTLPGGVYGWELDTTPPIPSAEFVLAEMAQSPTNLTAVSAVLAANDDIVEWSVALLRLDGRIWNEVVGGLLVSNVYGAAQPTTVEGIYSFNADGSHDGLYRLTVIGRDLADNWQSTPNAGGIHEWTFDRTPPVAVFKADELPPPNTPNRTARFVADAKGEVIVSWMYRVIQKSRVGVSLNPVETLVDWRVITEPEFYVTVVDEGAYTIELKGCDLAGNWQREIDDAGRFSWNVDEPSQLVGSIFRDTIATNGNLEVTIRIDMMNSGIFEFVLEEELNTQVPITDLSCSGANLLVWTPGAGITTNIYRWLLEKIPEQDEIVVKYTIPGVSDRGGLAGIVTWYEKTDRTERIRNLWVIPGKHVAAETVPIDPYRQWALDKGLDPDSPEGAPGGDADLDGVTNSDEYQADTDPDDVDSRFRLMDIRRISGRVFWLQWHAGPAATLEFNWKRDLLDQWQVLETLPGGRSAGDPWSRDFTLPADEAEAERIFIKAKAYRE